MVRNLILRIYERKSSAEMTAARFSHKPFGPSPLPGIQSKMADGVSWVNLHSQVTKADFYGFLKALDVWIEKPHVVNRRLMGALIIKKMSFERLSDKDLERFVLNQDFLEGACTTAESEQLTPSEREESVRLEDEEGEKLNNHEKEHLSRYVENGQDSIILRKLLPRQLDRKDAMFELVITGKVVSSLIKWGFIVVH